MQIIHYLPTENQLILSPITAQSVVELLTVPFTSLDEAKEFWLEYPSTIVVLNSKDTPEIVLAMLDDLSRHFIEQAELTPEFVEALPEGYQLSLTITSDSGNGFYLIKPTDMPLCKENTHE